MFRVTGISTSNGVTKVRYANDLVSRVKMLNKNGHTDINIFELPTALSKLDCVRYLKTTDLYSQFVEAIDAADEKYTSMGTVKIRKLGPSLEAIKARAGIITTL